jgi:glycosyltransferase involved in cell wall biosynthesis
MGFAPKPSVEVIVPARNEEDCIATCLESLVSQQGINFHITVVDDESSDRTRSIAESFSGVRVIGVGEACGGATGKCKALIRGAQESTAEWLLFTDADTFHLPGSLAAAVREGEERGVDLLSYSPEQEAISWGERALMPVVFAELVRVYPPARVNDPADALAAANGQYILVRRTVYEGLGGHAAVADRVLEDVELAGRFKGSGRKICFRHGDGLVRARMYRSVSAMLEGWTKNLALLFRHPVRLALIRALEFAILMAAIFAGTVFMVRHHRISAVACAVIALLVYWNFMARILAAHFNWRANLASVWGLPLFCFLLLRSYWQLYVRGAVTWKGRIYPHSASHAGTDSSL